MVNQRQLLLGAFFVIVLSLLGVYTLFLTDFSLFKERHTLVVHFSQASVMFAGSSRPPLAIGVLWSTWPPPFIGSAQ